MPVKDDLLELFNAGVAAVAGKESVENALEKEHSFEPDLIIALGKAASGMCLGAQAVFGQSIPALIATKYDHTDPELRTNPNVSIIESAHPIPDQNSLVAGQMLLDAVLACSKSSRLLLLVSGGASAIVESLPDNISLNQWQALNTQWVSSGMNIQQINEQRKSISQIKGGRLLEHFRGKHVLSCAISDVEGDAITTIGSGIGDISRTRATADVKMVASNKIARQAVTKQAAKLGYEIKQNQETLYDDVFKLSTQIGKFICKADKGMYIWGGEPTIKLPENPGNGGRNQSLALALAKQISGREGICILVAGTDGTDGPTDAAGAIIDGATFRHAKAAQTALDNADAGRYLRDIGDILITGPTGTNVMDLVIALVE